MILLRFFIRSAGALLLAVAFALFLANFATGEVAQPRDPVLQVSMRWLFWIVGVVMLAGGWHCLFGNRSFTQLALVAWIAANLVIYKVGLIWTGVQNSAVMLGSLPDTFGITAGTAVFLSNVVIVYLFAGSFALMIWLWKQARTGKWSLFEDDLVRIFCPACGGHIRYAVQNSGQQIPCPHCKAEITLRKPENLKMSCFFCHGHIEFPSHSVGEKMPCPHCKQDITLKLSSATRA